MLGKFKWDRSIPCEGDKARILMALTKCERVSDVWLEDSGVRMRLGAHCGDPDFYSWRQAARIAGVELEQASAAAASVRPRRKSPGRHVAARRDVEMAS